MIRPVRRAMSRVCLVIAVLMLMAPAPISETCNVPSCRVFILFRPRADSVVVLWTSADWSEQPVHNGPTTSPAPSRLVLVTKSRRLRWLSDLLAVAARSRVGIRCSKEGRFQCFQCSGMAPKVFAGSALSLA